MIDAECSIECKSGPSQGPNGERMPGNPKAWIVGGRCLMEMARWSDAVEWLERAIEREGAEGTEDHRELVHMLVQARAQVQKKK